MLSAFKTNLRLALVLDMLFRNRLHSNSYFFSSKSFQQNTLINLDSLHIFVLHQPRNHRRSFNLKLNLIRQGNIWRGWLVLIILFHFILLFFLGFSRHWGYMNSIYDTGIFDQAVWGILHNKPFINTTHFDQPINWLGFHFHPILALFAFFYLIIPTVNWFIAAQAAALSTTAWAIFLLGRHVSCSEKAGFLWALVFLVNPFLLSAAAWDFHPISLALPFIAFAFLSIELKNFRLLLLSSFIILLCKEHLGMMVAGFGIIWWIKNRYWKTSVALITIGIIHCVIVFGVIMPMLSPIATHLMLSNGNTDLSRYSWMGNTFIEIFYTLIRHPMSVIKTVMVNFGGTKYLFILLLLFLGFPVLASELLLPATADLLSNLLSSNPMPRSIFAYHSISIIPVFTVASIYGAKRIFNWTKKFSSNELAGFVFTASFIAGYLLSPLPLPGARNFWEPVYFLNFPDPRVQSILSLVGNNTSVSAQANIGSHFSQRSEIYCYPNKLGEADTIILRLQSPTKNVSMLTDKKIVDRKQFIGMLDSHLQMDRAEYIASIECLLSNKEYGVLIWNDPWLVFSKNSKNYDLREKIKQKLYQLRKEWKIYVDE